MSDIAQTRNAREAASAELLVDGEAYRYAWLTVMFFFTVFGGLTGILVAAHYVSALMS